MYALWYYFIGFIIIWVVGILFRKQLKIDVEGPIMMRRTKRLRGFIDRIAQRSPRFWKWTMNLGIPVGFFFMFFMLYFLILSLETLLEAPSVGLIIPGVDIPGQPFYLPFSYGIIGLATVIVVHEFGHGILARVEGVSIKSIGLLLLAILPGAFVEPDDEEVKKLSRLSKLRIYVAGSISNLILAIISLIIIVFLTLLTISGLSIGIPGVAVPGTSINTETVYLNISGPIYPMFHTEGVKIDSVVPTSPAEGVLQPGMIISNINGKPTTNSSQYLQALNGTKIGDTLTFQTDKGTYTVVTEASPNNASKAYIGIRTTDNQVVNSDVSKTWGNTVPWLVFPIITLFNYIFILNFLVGTFNLLPMKPLDGGLMFEELLRTKISEKNVRRITYPFTVILITILVVSLVYGLGRGLTMLF